MKSLFEMFCIVFLLMILNVLHTHFATGKKVIIREDTCSDFFDLSIEDPYNRTTSWVPNEERGKYDCSICNSQDAANSWLVTKPVQGLNSTRIHVSVTIFRSECSNCKNQDIKVYVLHSTLPTDKRQAFLLLKSLPLVAKLSNGKDLTEKTHDFYLEPKPFSFSMAFLSAGSCTVMKEITIYYIACEKNTSSLSPLPQTIAPASGLQRVNVSCSEKSVNPDGEEAYGLCSSEGTWKITSPCVCKKGYTLNVGKECIECEEKTYKDMVGNGKCIPCPRNSDTSAGKIKCQCENGFYRFRGESHTKPCHEIPSSVVDVNYSGKTESSVTLLWNTPIRRTDQDLLYDVTCTKCILRIDGEPCTEPCGPLVAFLPSQHNLTYTHVIIQGLNENTEYQFVVYSKNQNSLRIDKTNWEWKSIRIKTEGATNLSTTGSDNVGLVVGISVAAVLVLILASLLVYCHLKHKRGEADYAQPTIKLSDIPQSGDGYEEPTQRAQPNNNVQLNRELPTIPNVKGIYEEPSEYTQLDTSKRVPMDGNYQGLNAHYTKLDRSLNEDVQDYMPLNMNSDSGKDFPQQLEDVKVIA